MVKKMGLNSLVQLRVVNAPIVFLGGIAPRVCRIIDEGSMNYPYISSGNVRILSRSGVVHPSSIMIETCGPYLPLAVSTGQLQKEREASKEKRTEKEKGKKEKRTEKERGKKEKRERSNEDKNESLKDRERAHKKRRHNETSEQRMKDGSHGLHMNTKDACKMVAVKKNEPHTKDTCKIAAAETNDLHMKGVFQEAAVKTIEVHTKDAFQKAAVKMNEVRMKDLDHQKGAVKDVPKDASQVKMSEVHMKGVSHRKAAVKDGTEQLERSWLTEEHGVPCRTPEPCESSESTQNSSRSRKPDATAFSHQGSTIIRFKLPLQKHKDPKPTVVNSEEPCFSGQTISKDPEPTAAKNEVPCFSGRVTEAPTETRLGESSKRRRDKEKKFRDLMVNWNPVPFLAAEDAADDLGWLLGNSHQNRESSEAKSRTVGSSGVDMTCGSAACCFQPRAGYLPEFEMYQMPYAIPF